jgi:hypothetical protein
MAYGLLREEVQTLLKYDLSSACELACLSGSAQQQQQLQGNNKQ